MKYPVGPVYRMLLLTGLRLNEAARLSWPEVHGDTIIIPASRMKGKDATAREHLVPLSSAAQEIIASLPRYRGAPFLFSLQRGQAATGDDQPDQARPRPAHAADAQGDGPPSRRGSSRRHAAELDQPRSAPRRPLRSVGACASRTTSPKPCWRTGRPASSASTTPTNISMRNARRWRRGRSGIASIVNPVPAAPAKVIKLPRRRR